MPNYNPKPPQKLGRDISVEDYLNKTKEKHNNKGYAEWRFLRDEKKYGATRLAEEMNVAHTDTIYKWIAAEQERL